MKRIYCLSGLGADESAFKKLKIPGHELRVINWKEPLKNETISEYAIRLCAEVKEENPVMMGLSFGGMMCIEMAKHIPVSRIILISSIKSKAELPGWMKGVGKLKLNKVVPVRSYKLTEFIQNYFLGANSREEKEMVRRSRKQATTTYTHWAVNEVMNWQNEWYPGTLHHIHGTKDRIFNYRNIHNALLVNDGGHFMIVNKHQEISEILNNLLNK
jgi:pimeloyl-ACP methyl ester carboxylesterase